MENTDLTLMAQTTINLIGIVDDQREHEATEVMSGLMRLARQIEESKKTVIEEMRGARNPDNLHAAMMAPNLLAAQFHAQDFLSVNRRAKLNFSSLLGHEDIDLTPEAVADAMVWISIADQTLVAIKLLFQVSRLYGRAPNGRRLAAPA